MDPRFNGKVIQVDVTQEDSVVSLFNHTTEALGRIDYCINSAGVRLPFHPLEISRCGWLTPVPAQVGAQVSTDIAELSLAEFQRFQGVNNSGMFLVTRQASIVMRAQEEVPVSTSNPKRGSTRGSIVNIGSASALVATPGVLPYTTSKHAALGLTKNSGKFSFCSDLEGW